MKRCKHFNSQAEFRILQENVEHTIDIIYSFENFVTIRNMQRNQDAMKRTFLNRIESGICVTVKLISALKVR